MEGKGPPFRWSDAWVLLALIYAQTPAVREHLRLVGDSINHAVFTDEELEGGIRRLKAAGYATEEHDRVGATPVVRDWYPSVGPSSRRYVWADMKRVERFLGVSSP